MATRFAIKTGLWSDTTLWDNGALPVSGDVIYPNGFAVTIDQDINVASLNNNTSNVYLPNMAIPAMTGNTQPSGVAFSTQNPTQAYLAFNQLGSQWSSGVANVGTIGYTFTSTKYIVRYYFRSQGGQEPTNWTFQGSNDNFATAGVILHTGTTGGSNFVSPIFTNTVGYTSYRLVITTCSGNNICAIRQFEMTESATASYGAVTGGSFTVPASLSGTRNIVFNNFSSGIFMSGSGSFITIAALSGNTVNISNSVANGYIIGGGALATSGATAYGINVTGNCTVNLIGSISGYTGGGSQTGDTSTGLYVGNNATVNITGNLYGGTAAWSAGANGVVLGSSTPSLTLIGNVFSNTTTGLGQALAINTNSIVNITGNISQSGVGLTMGSGGSGTINITGTITSSGTARALGSSGTANINVISGIITASSSSPALVSSSTGLVTVGNSPLINTNNVMAVNAIRIRLYSPASIQWQFQDNLGGTKTLYSAGGSVGLPLTTNVRSGIIYGASNELTGTMVVPVNANVRKGVQVDVQPNVGTADLTAEDIFNAISTSTNPVAIRLKNISTVQTTGDQITSLT